MPKSNKGLKFKWNDELNCQLITNGNNCLLFNTDIFNLLKKINRKYECIWLDLPCPISNELIEKIRNIHIRLNDKCSSFILTVLGARETDFITRDNIKKYGSRLNYITRSIEEILSDFKLLYQWQYNDSSPMIHSIFVK